MPRVESTDVAADRTLGLPSHEESHASTGLEERHRDAVEDARSPVLPGRRARQGRPRRTHLRWALVAADVYGLTLAFFVSQLLLGAAGAEPERSAAESLWLGLTLPVWVGLATLYGLYDRDGNDVDHSTVDELMDVFHFILVGILIVAVGASIAGIVEFTYVELGVFCILAFLLVAGSRIAARIAWRRTAHPQRVVIVGAGRTGQFVAKKLLRRPELGLKVVGFVDADPMQLDEELSHLEILGPPDELPGIAGALEVDRVIIAFSRNREEKTGELLKRFRAEDVRINIVPRLYDSLGLATSMRLAEGLPLVALPMTAIRPSFIVLKRTMDISLSAILLVILTPLFLLIAACLRIESPGAAFYKHERIGLNGKPFRLFKFRTMLTEYCVGDDFGGDNAELELERILTDAVLKAQMEQSQKLRDDPRVTRIGAFLRQTSLDEFPQLINVLRGEMSLVGPRPVTAAELDRYGDDVSLLLEAKPGMTGYWQISGRSNLDYAERVRLDLAYVSSRSLHLDIKILLKTLRARSWNAGAY